MSEKEKKTTTTVKTKPAVKHTHAKVTVKSEEPKASAAPTKRVEREERREPSYEKRRGSYGKNAAPKDFQLIRESIEKKIDAFFEANKDAGLRKLISASKLMEAGAHIGMSAKLWNPKMSPFIYPKKGGKMQIIDILKTMVFMDRAYNFLRDITKDGGRVIFVGTRGDIIKEHIKNEAKRAKSFYINQRWLGGTLTNFKTLSKSIDKLNNLIMLQLSDEIKKYSKKEQVVMSKETERMGRFLGGIRTMRGLPQAIVVTDPVIEHNAVAEAKLLGIPVIAFANTNANPNLIDFIIPANTGSIRTVYLLISIMVDAICEGNGEATNVIGKKDEEIILPDVIKKVHDGNIIQHKRFGRDRDQTSSSSIEVK